MPDFLHESFADNQFVQTEMQMVCEMFWSLNVLVMCVTNSNRWGIEVSNQQKLQLRTPFYHEQYRQGKVDCLSF